LDASGLVVVLRDVSTLAQCAEAAVCGDGLAKRKSLICANPMSQPGAMVASGGALMSQTDDKLEQLALALMYSGLHDERWVWKTIPFEVTDRLHQQGLIDEPRSHRKSLCLSDDGLERAKAAFEALCTGRTAI
jgi:hypothetical protein